MESLVFVVVSYVAAAPVTATDITAPRSAPVNTYVAVVAPEIFVVTSPAVRFH
ncbi:unannotated protein [freshwater metagenome]|uniref:Unannotated protein n=1 Tax=freshwater metagenome TaxID=449393 RepID=A0A6J7DIA5_9ZZZZ